MAIELLEKKTTFWLSHIAELIDLWTTSDFTSASVKQRYLSGKRYLGSKDKKIISLFEPDKRKARSLLNQAGWVLNKDDNLDQ